MSTESNDATLQGGGSAIADIREQLSECETKLYEATGFLNVLNKAVGMDRHFESGDEHHGYSSVIGVANTIICETARQLEALQGKLYRHGDFLDGQLKEGSPSTNRGSAR